nr:SGNH/GDSL hydrolase family protein [Neobacillus sp. Marseille-Q6967]
MKNAFRIWKWVGSWSVSPVDFTSAPLHFNKQTLRAKIKLSIGGKKIRLKLSNRFGHQSIYLSGVTVALADKDSGIAEGTNRPVTFNGESSITINPGQEVVISDEIELETTDLDCVSISLVFPEKTRVTTAYFGSSECYTSIQGDYSNTASFPFDKERIKTGMEAALPLLTGIDVLTGEEYSSVVTFGDSITAMDWPDYFAERLKKESMKLGVLRQGIGGNKVLNDSPETHRYGIAGIDRFETDVVQQTGVKYVIVLQGVNDIIHSCGPNPISIPVCAEEIIAGLKKYIQLAHEKNIKIFGATIMPFGGYNGITTQEEKKRQQVNNWIRTSGEFDAVIDFDKVTQNPDNPNELLPVYDSGDHLHPSKNGAKAMADSIDVSFFKYFR